MNELIRELEAQCWEPRKHPASQAAMGDKFNTAKFAELIVRECIDVISPYAVRMENFDGGHPIADLKEHFGVEE